MLTLSLRKFARQIRSLDGKLDAALADHASLLEASIRSLELLKGSSNHVPKAAELGSLEGLLGQIANEWHDRTRTQHAAILSGLASVNDSIKLLSAECTARLANLEQEFRRWRHAEYVQSGANPEAAEEVSRSLAERDEQMLRLQRQISVSDEEVSRLRRAASARDEEISRLESMLNRHEAAFQDRVKELVRELGEKAASLEELRRQVQKMKRSYSWKLTTPIREVRRAWIRLGRYWRGLKSPRSRGANAAGWRRFVGDK